MRSKAYIVDIETKGLTTNGFQDIIKRRLLQEACFDSFNVREFAEKIDLESHITAEGKILDQDGYGGRNKTFSKTDGKHDFWIYFGLSLSFSDIKNIIRREGYLPVHYLC